MYMLRHYQSGTVELAVRKSAAVWEPDGQTQLDGCTQPSIEAMITKLLRKCASAAAARAAAAAASASAASARAASVAAAASAASARAASAAARVEVVVKEKHLGRALNHQSDLLLKQAAALVQVVVAAAAAAAAAVNILWVNIKENQPSRGLTRQYST